MITKSHYREDLELAILSGHPIGRIIAMLREIRDAGVLRQEVQSALDTLRAQAPDETTEDRVLEIMDIVSGYCSAEHSVWQD